jgi:hypothetical protein
MATRAAMRFTDRTRRRQRGHQSLLCVGLDPEPARFPGPGRATPRASSTSARHRRRHQGPGLRLQAADRLLRRAPRRGPARAADGAHPARRARRAGDPGRQARRHRRHRRAVRARGLRALPGRRGDAVALHGLRLDRALPALRRQGPVPAVPHLQPRRRRPAGAALADRRAALRAHRPLAATPGTAAASSAWWWAPPTRRDRTRARAGADAAAADSRRRRAGRRRRLATVRAGWRAPRPALRC